MKKGNLLIIILGCCLVFTSCKKEEIVRLDADIENYSGQKAFIDNQDFSCFAAGDKVNINGGEYTVSGITNGGRNVTFDVTSASGYKAVFPSTLTTNLAAINSPTVTVNLPSSQAYTTEKGSQKIDIPMCGYLATAGGSIHFRNLCALLEITINNNTSDTLYYNRIEVSTSNCALSGSGYIDNITSDTPSIVMNSGSSKSVALTFGSEQTLANGATNGPFYVIIPKATGATSFKISLIGQGSIRTSKICYERTKNSTFTFNRNKIYPITFSSPTKKEVATYKFSVSANTKVIFAPGNLQWSATNGGTTATTHKTADGTAAGTWRFAEHQWDFVGFSSSTYGNVYGVGGNSSTKCDNTQASATYQGWIDLFGWGTSGYDSKYPYNKGNFDASKFYHDPNNYVLTNTNYDWGEYNYIYNPVNNRTEPCGTWRTFSKAEFDYIKSNGKMGLAKVRGYDGIVILPDDYVLPSDISFTPSNKSYDKNTYDADKWTQLENIGAVFLPKAGRREPNGTQIQCDYSTSTSTSGSRYYYFEHVNNGIDWGFDSKAVATPVRLVKEVQ